MDWENAKTKGPADHSVAENSYPLIQASDKVVHVIPRSLGPYKWFYLGRSSSEPLGVVSRQAITLSGLKTIDSLRECYLLYDHTICPASGEHSVAIASYIYSDSRLAVDPPATVDRYSAASTVQKE
jgi:hypothetical protein